MFTPYSVVNGFRALLGFRVITLFISAFERSAFCARLLKYSASSCCDSSSCLRKSSWFSKLVILALHSHEAVLLFAFAVVKESELETPILEVRILATVIESNRTTFLL